MIEIPPSIKKLMSKEVCPVHQKNLYIINGIKHCGECRIIKANKAKEEKIKAHGDGNLTEYYAEKKPQRTKKNDIVNGKFGGK